MKKSSLDEDLRLPIKIDSTSNGEYMPREDPATDRVAALAMERALRNAARIGMSRREYLASTCGAATVLASMNALGCGGGTYNVPKEAPHEPAAADAAVKGTELVIDVQLHHVAADRVWWKEGEPSLADFISRIPTAQPCLPAWAKCYTDDVLIREVFTNSDTAVGIISGLWGDPLPMLTEEAQRTREKVQRLGKDRVRIHAAVQPTADPWTKVAEGMKAQAEELEPAAWKLYTIWSPTKRGWWLTDEIGRKTIEHGIAVGVPIFAVHKGVPLAGMDPTYTRPTDVGPAAKAHPGATFLIYHAGWEPDRPEGPYDPKAERGIDALIASCVKAGIGKTGNVYAELGSTWRELMKRPDEAAHALGKLMLHLGEDRILWGTDAIWFGSPQDQIQAFRAFEITAQFQEQYGYPALTPERKAKILGLNAARVYGIDVAQLAAAHRRDETSIVRAEVANAPQPTFQTYGPRTRRDMLRLLDFLGGKPD